MDRRRNENACLPTANAIKANNYEQTKPGSDAGLFYIYWSF
jgi:hypothetical protein